MATTARSPYTSATAQALSDSDHCTVIPSSPPPPSTSPSSLSVNPIQRARSGSRTYSEVQAEERELARRRTTSRERNGRGGTLAEDEEEEDPSNQDGGLSYGELKAEMETLLSLRRRSMSQPLTVDPDLPPSQPASSSPLPPSSTSSSSSSHSSSTSPSSSTSHSSTSSSRPKLSLTINTSHLHQPHPTGGPISPTAPSPAETGTLIRRKSSVSNPRLPSEHPLPLSPPPLPINPLTSPISVSHFSSESSDNEESLSSPLYDQDQPSPSPPSSSTYQPSSPNIIRSTHASTPDQNQSQTPTQDLFWLPASLHPELAPQEFKAFIREQTSPEALARRTSINKDSQGGAGLGRNGSKLGPNGSLRGVVGVGRRSSMLRGEYKPRLNDGVSLQEDSPVQLTRASSLKRSGSQSSTHSTTGGGGGLAFEELTIRDLQRLEELAQRAEREQELKEGEGEGERLGRVLRRSLSLNPHRMAEAAAAAGAQFPDTRQHSLSSSLPASYGSTIQHDSSSDQSVSPTASVLEDTLTEEDYDSPLIVPPPGQILRRNARTKIRKTGPGGEISFGGYRSGGSRLGGGGAGSGRRARTSSDGSNLAAGGDEESTSSVGGGDNTSVESHEMIEGGGRDDLRASTSSLGSITSSTNHTTPTSNGPLPVYSHSGPIESPPLDGGAQYLEIATPSPPIPHIEVQQPTKRGSPTSPTGAPVLPPVSKPISPPPATLAQTEQSPAVLAKISPASAEYDWASQHLVQPTPPPAPKPVQQYSVHPAHGPSLPPPAPQAVPIPQPERERSNSVYSMSSNKSTSTNASSHVGREKEGVKEKKSGWAAKLGLGSSDDKKKKGKGKEKDHSPHSHQNEKSETVMVEDHRTGSTNAGTKESTSAKQKEKEGGTSNSLFGGLFGRRRNEYDSPPASSTTTSSHSHSNSTSTATSAALAPPPPPTASGALLPNGRYANFYRLPIHVERAIYRLSHIKLANPRRPLYEQVLISNLMFWYLGLIQKPQPPPAAPPVPIPGKRNQQQNSQPNQKKGHKSNPTGGQAPRVGDIVPNHGREMNRDQQQQDQNRYGPPHQSQPNVENHHAPMNHNQSPPSSIPEYNHLPSSSPPNHDPRYSTPQQQREEEDDSSSDDDRPLAEARSRSNSRSPQRRISNEPPLLTTSPPPSSSSSRPTPISTVPKPSESPGFEVTSRRITPPLSSHQNQNYNLSATSNSIGSEKDENGVDKRVSVLSNKSLSEIYEAYSLSTGATGGGEAGTTVSGGGGTTPPRGSSLQARNPGEGAGRDY